MNRKSFLNTRQFLANISFTHSFVICLEKTTTGFFYHLLSKLSQLSKLMITLLYNGGFISSKLHLLDASLVLTSHTRSESNIMKDGLLVVI